MAVSVRIQRATRDRHDGQRGHDLRQGKTPHYVDPERSRHNQVVIEPPDSATMADEALARRQRRYERGAMKRRPRSVRSDASVAIEGIITFSHDAQATIEALDVDDQAERYRAAVDAIAEQLGTSVAGLVIHRDESAPHAHFTLHGYDPSGEPVSKRVLKGTLSSIQDAAATAYSDLGITRGTPIGQRIQDGDDPAATIHRSVSQLHRDLPHELAQAQQRVEQAKAEAEKQERRLERAQQQLAQTQGQSDKLAKKVERYERRLERARERVERAKGELDRLAQADPSPPKTRVRQIPTTEGQVVTGSTRLRYIDPQEAKQWEGQLLRRERKAEQRAQKAEQRASDAEQAHDEVLDALLEAPSTSAGEPPADHDAALWTARAPLVERYGVQLQAGEHLARVPPQEASARQTAAALYRYGREMGWPEQWFDVDRETAAAVIELAVEDGRLEHISLVRDEEQQRMLEAALERYWPDTGPSPGPG